MVVECKCGFKLGLNDEHVEEMAAGVWGCILCPKCNFELNDKIQEKNTPPSSQDARRRAESGK